jgi:hypothetical protein
MPVLGTLPKLSKNSERLSGSSLFQVVTSVLGPMLTESFATRLPTLAVESEPDENPPDEVIVPVGEHHALV